MKGILLAGGLGTRLYPSTHVVSKLLLPVYDKPMIYYSLSTLLLTGIRDILIISTPQYIPLLKNLLGDGNQWGVSFSYAHQVKPQGIAEAFIIGEKFIGNNQVALILGDNLFHGAGLETRLELAMHKSSGVTLFAYYVDTPQHYGVIEFDKNHQPVSLVEKPQTPASHYAVTGLYFYDNQVTEMAKNLPFSARNELEITDINKLYLQKQQVSVEILGRGFTWLDTGTHESLLKASIYVEVVETRQGLKIGCPEEIAWRKGYISDQQLEALAKNMKNLNYKEYLLKIINQ